MKLPPAKHRWNISPRRAIQLQCDLAPRIITSGRVPDVRLIAGADMAFSPDGTRAIAGVVVWRAADQTVVEQRLAVRPVRFPYVPGLLSFREAPVLLAAIRKLRHEPDVFLFDGQGFAHPRRFGLACHLGLLIDRPSIGCAKSLLIGTHRPLPAPRGSTADLLDNAGTRIGQAVRTRDAVRPLYVSVGHRLSLAAAVKIVLSCCTRYRLPEPTRLADRLVSSVRAR